MSVILIFRSYFGVCLKCCFVLICDCQFCVILLEYKISMLNMEFVVLKCLWRLYCIYDVIINKHESVAFCGHVAIVYDICGFRF